jgi:hypothetical protein
MLALVQALLYLLAVVLLVLVAFGFSVRRAELAYLAAASALLAYSLPTIATGFHAAG